MRMNERWMKDGTVGGKTSGWIYKLGFAVALLAGTGLTGTPAMAQTGGDGAIRRSAYSRDL